MLKIVIAIAIYRIRLPGILFKRAADDRCTLLEVYTSGIRGLKRSRAGRGTSTVLSSMMSRGVDSITISSNAFQNQMRLLTTE